MARFTDYRTFRTAIGGRLLELEIGKVCEQANGQVMVRYGESVVNVTACASKAPRPDIDFFPLSCDYEERMYAAGKIPEMSTGLTLSPLNTVSDSQPAKMVPATPNASENAIIWVAP